MVSSRTLRWLTFREEAVRELKAVGFLHGGREAPLETI